MKILKNKTALNSKTIESFFHEEDVKDYIYQKSTSDRIIFPWDTKAPIVYKLDDQYIKVHGLKRKSHFFTKKRTAVTISKLHDFLRDNKIKTIRPNLIVVNGKYSMVGTPDIHKMGLKLLKEVDLKTQIDVLDEIHKDLLKLRLYHYDNKPENAVIDTKTGEYYLLDIDSVRVRTLFRNPEWKLKKRTTQYHNDRINEFKCKIRELEMEDALI